MIEGPASSILELTANMIRTCNMVGRADAFAQRAIEMLLIEVAEFYRLVRSAGGDSTEPTTGETAAAPTPVLPSGGTPM
jgi:hypothetical protein